MSRLINHFPSYMTGGGIFAHLSGVPWDNDLNVDKINLDIDYFGNHSGFKLSSPLIEKFTCLHDDCEIDDVEMSRLCSIIKGKFLVSWVKLWDAIRTDYNPLENYSMIETTTPGIVTTVKSQMDSKTENTTNASVYAFNSTAAQPTSTANGTTETTGNKDNNYTQESKTGFDTLTRSGNIGVTTSQQMLESEINIRKTQFFDIVFNDVDKILTCPIWAERC